MAQNLNRRRWVQAFAAVTAGTLAAPALARNDCVVFTRETQAAVTPDAAL